MTEEQVSRAVEYSGRKMLMDGVDLNDPLEIAKWMVQHPLPSEAEYEAQLDEWEVQDRATRIAQLENEIELLKAAEE